MAATAVYFGTGSNTTGPYLSNVADPSAGAASDYVIYFNGQAYPESWDSRALATYDAPSDLNDIILGGNIKGIFQIRDNKMDVTGETTTNLNNFKKAFQDWSLNDDVLYYWEKNTSAYNMAQFPNSSGTLTQIRVKWFKWAVTYKEDKIWKITVTFQRVSPATEI